MSSGSTVRGGGYKKGLEAQGRNTIHDNTQIQLIELLSPLKLSHLLLVLSYLLYYEISPPLAFYRRGEK